MDTKKIWVTILKVLLLVISGVLLFGSIIWGPLFSTWPAGNDKMIPLSFISGIIFIVILIWLFRSTKKEGAKS
jgi:hypothetical protein